MKILAVDDTLMYREMLKQLLASHGEVHEAEDGELAVAAFVQAHEAGEPFDLVFMDVLMPNMDGHQAAQAMRKQEVVRGILSEHEVPIVMLTTMDEPKRIMQAYFRDGCSQYVNKPMTQEKLDEVLSALGR